MRCPKCGAKDQTTKFCGACGFQLIFDDKNEPQNKSGYVIEDHNVGKNSNIGSGLFREELWQRWFVFTIIATVLSLLLMCTYVGPIMGVAAIITAVLSLKHTDRSRIVLTICVIIACITVFLGIIYLMPLDSTQKSKTSGRTESTTVIGDYSKSVRKTIEKIDKYIAKEKYDKASDLISELELPDTDPQKVRLKVDLALAQNQYDNAATAIFTYAASKEDKSLLADDEQFTRLKIIAGNLNETNRKTAGELINNVKIAKIESESGHDWKEATCTEPKTCALCGEKEGAALGHDWEEATCTKPKTCKRCKITEGDPLGHVSDEWSVVEEATCSKEGSEKAICTICGEEVTRSIPKTEHTEGDWEITVEASDKSNGRRVKKCTVCGEELASESYSLTEEEKREYYKKNCESVSYDDLIRYPDKYKDTPIKIKVKIKDVETVDSMLFKDQYEGILNGKSISIMDDREVKEPKLRAGDSVTIYGVGAGYNTQYTYQKGLILGLPKNIESEKIPCVSMLYVSF